ncbi:MAG: hypothetical protein NC131_02405 [Roseburia sp.]|nr:hypothetical protein [Roseburia sp.]
MRKRKILILLLVIVLIIVFVPLLAVLQSRSAAADESTEGTAALTVWQIDGFEGGRGSRSQYLQSAGVTCFKNEKVYLNVTSLSAEAARANLEAGTIPDIISYPSGFYGLENFVNSKDFTYKNWCRGGYCFLTLDENADFSDITAENTVINVGKDNLSGVAAILCGVGGADFEEPTNAYLRLLGGKYKYLLGTQRDVFRLKTRNASFSVKPITVFNDLYQNFSILTGNCDRYNLCRRFIDFVLANDKVDSLGLFYGGKWGVDELKPMAEAEFEFVLNCPCGKEYADELKRAAQTGDVNKLKNLLK